MLFKINTNIVIIILHSRTQPKCLAPFKNNKTTSCVPNKLIRDPYHISESRANIDIIKYACINLTSKEPHATHSQLALASSCTPKATTTTHRECVASSPFQTIYIRLFIPRTSLYMPPVRKTKLHAHSRRSPTSFQNASNTRRWVFVYTRQPKAGRVLFGENDDYLPGFVEHHGFAVPTQNRIPEWAPHLVVNVYVLSQCNAIRHVPTAQRRRPHTVPGF